MSNLNLNSVILCGRLTATPELKVTQGGGISVTSFNVAVARPKQKDKPQETDFINCVAWRNTAEFIAKYFAKGNAICVEGAIQTRKWTDKDNNNRIAVEVIVDKAHFVDSRDEGSKSAEPAPGGGEYEPVADGDSLPF